MERFSKRQWIVLITLATCNFLSAVVYSLQAPFYPAEAEKKGASTTFAGIVLGIYELVGFLSCPLISSKVLHKLGSFTCFHIGILTSGTTTLFFGFLNRVNDTTTFISLSLVLRILEAVGAATTFVSSYGFLNICFPNSIGTVFAVMETMFAIGMASGPPIGEALYELGMGSEEWSFTVPFLTMGLVMYFATFLTSMTLWPMRNVVGKDDIDETREKCNGEVDKNGVVEKEKSASFIAFLKIPSIFVFYLTIMGGSIGLGFLTCTLEPHLRQFELTPVQIGGMFLVYGGAYAGTASIWGLICDKTGRPIFVTLIGTVLAIFAFMFMGPCILIPLKPSKMLTAVSLGLFGLATGAVYVSGFLLMMIEAKHHGFRDTSTLSSSISALWLSGMHFGSFIGPILGGALFEKYGFGVETLFIVVHFTVILILLLIVFARTSDSSLKAAKQNIGSKKSNSEKTPLLLLKEETAMI